MPLEYKNKKKTVDKPKPIRYTMNMSKEINKYFSELGRKGGSVRSERKANASRKNGKLGGRPKLQTKIIR